MIIRITTLCQCVPHTHASRRTGPVSRASSISSGTGRSAVRHTGHSAFISAHSSAHVGCAGVRQVHAPLLLSRRQAASGARLPFPASPVSSKHITHSSGEAMGDIGELGLCSGSPASRAPPPGGASGASALRGSAAVPWPGKQEELVYEAVGGHPAVLGVRPGNTAARDRAQPGGNREPGELHSTIASSSSEHERGPIASRAGRL